MSQVIPEGWVKASLSEVVAVNPKHKDLEDQVAGFVPMALAPTDFNGTLGYEERQWDKIKKATLILLRVMLFLPRLPLVLKTEKRQ